MHIVVYFDKISETCRRKSKFFNVNNIVGFYQGDICSVYIHIFTCGVSPYSNSDFISNGHNEKLIFNVFLFLL